MNHDPLCPMQEPDPGDTVRQSSCLCFLIAIVRADERGKAGASSWWRLRAMEAERECVVLRRERADLRAKVKELPGMNLSPMNGRTVRLVDLDDVLAAIDGSGQ